MYAGYCGVARDHVMWFAQPLKDEFVSDGNIVYNVGQSVKGKVCHV